jgi:predicted HAD superfamily Cof-like phosphohydrolase
MPSDLGIASTAGRSAPAGREAAGPLDAQPMLRPDAANGHALPEKSHGIPSGIEHPAAMPGAGLSEAMLAVGQFHQAFGLPRSGRASADVPDSLARLRVDLLVEEVGEFADATTARDLVGLADALADIVYVAYGAAITYGIDLDAALREVHRSNMSKLDEHGRPIHREDGKVLKSARYTPPDIAGVLYFQPPLPF